MASLSRSFAFVQPSMASLVVPRAYRLVDTEGEPHPVLDDLYESHELAWAEALRWWQSQDHTSQEPIGIGVEVSTSNGDWRTIRYPCS
jgi:hypothetical protein